VLLVSFFHKEEGHTHSYTTEICEKRSQPTPKRL